MNNKAVAQETTEILSSLEVSNIISQPIAINL